MRFGERDVQARSGCRARFLARRRSFAGARRPGGRCLCRRRGRLPTLGPATSRRTPGVSGVGVIVQRVVQGDRLHDGADVVIAVGPPGQHVQRQVDLWRARPRTGGHGRCPGSGILRRIGHGQAPSRRPWLRGNAAERREHRANDMRSRTCRPPSGPGRSDSASLGVRAGQPGRVWTDTLIKGQGRRDEQSVEVGGPAEVAPGALDQAGAVRQALEPADDQPLAQVAVRPVFRVLVAADGGQGQMRIFMDDLADPLNGTARRVEVVEVKVAAPLLAAGVAAAAQPDMERRFAARGLCPVLESASGGPAPAGGPCAPRGARRPAACNARGRRDAAMPSGPGAYRYVTRAKSEPCCGSLAWTGR